VGGSATGRSLNRPDAERPRAVVACARGLMLRPGCAPGRWTLHPVWEPRSIVSGG
jgi:hypothetical protein